MFITHRILLYTHVATCMYMYMYMLHVSIGGCKFQVHSMVHTGIHARTCILANAKGTILDSLWGSDSVAGTTSTTESASVLLYTLYIWRYSC